MNYFEGSIFSALYIKCFGYRGNNHMYSKKKLLVWFRCLMTYQPL